MDKFREFLVPAEWQIGGPPVTERGDQVAVSKAAFTEAVELIDELEKTIEWYGNNMSKIHNIDFVYDDYGTRSDTALAKIKQFKDKG